MLEEAAAMMNWNMFSKITLILKVYTVYKLHLNKYMYQVLRVTFDLTWLSEVPYTRPVPVVDLTLHSKLEIICDLLNEGFLVYSIGNCLWDFFHRLFGLITHLKVFKKKIAEDSL